MIKLDTLARNEIRRTIDFESDGEAETIVIKNPNAETSALFFDLLEESYEEEDSFYLLEFLLKNLTNIEINKPLKDIIEGGNMSDTLLEIIKELTTIMLELVRRFIANVDVIDTLDTARRLLEGTQEELAEDDKRGN